MKALAGAGHELQPPRGQIGNRQQQDHRHPHVGNVGYISSPGNGDRETVPSLRLRLPLRLAPSGFERCSPAKQMATKITDNPPKNPSGSTTPYLNSRYTTP